MQTKLLGQPVSHLSFGKGIITEVSDKIITVRFTQGNKNFLYPEAFSNFLTLNDTTRQKEINSKYSKKLQIEKEKREKQSEAEERRRQLRSMKISPNSQAIFHLAVNDAEEIINAGVISTGCYSSGYSKGEARIPSRLKPNSACLLTGLSESKEEKDRRILGAFMVRDDFWGERCKNGMIEVHNRYKACLPVDTRLSFWNYLDHGDTLPHWGNVAFKYFSNSVMQRILLDMTGLAADAEQQAMLREFYQYFCRINRLPLQRILSGDK